MRIAGVECPEDLWYLVEHQVWARLHDDGTATVGITALGVKLAGEVYMCRPKVAGSRVEQGRSIAVVELAKSIVSVKSPLCGDVLEANPALAERPELVHEDPYGAGWIVRLRVADHGAEPTPLMRGTDVAEAMAHHAALYGLT